MHLYINSNKMGRLLKNDPVPYFVPALRVIIEMPINKKACHKFLCNRLSFK